MANQADVGTLRDTGKSNEGRDDPEELFRIVEELGKGSFGNVYQAIHLPTGREVALKVLRLDAMTDLKELKAEITLLSKIKCANIVKYFGSYIKNKNLWISMEYCDAGSALDLLIQLKKPFTESQIAVLLKQVLQGLHYLHTMNPPTIHRDIKSGNILLNSKGEVKLADFGIAAQLTDTIAKRHTQIGSPFWMAPEIIQENPYDTKVDIWSLGITAIELAQLKPPHWDAGSIRALFLIATKPPPTLDQPEKYSPGFSKFITNCVSKSPTERPTALQLLDHTFIKGAGKNDILVQLVEECFLEESEKSDVEKYENSSFNSTSMARVLSNSGLPTSSSNSNVGQESPYKLVVRGISQEGETLTAEVEGLPPSKDNSAQHRFLWFRSIPGTDDEFMAIPNSTRSNVYVIVKEDIECRIKCTFCILKNSEDGESTTNIFTTSYVTDVVQAGYPTIKKLRMEGGPYYTRAFKLAVDYFGGDEGKSVDRKSVV